MIDTREKAAEIISAIKLFPSDCDAVAAEDLIARALEEVRLRTIKDAAYAAGFSILAITAEAGWGQVRRVLAMRRIVRDIRKLEKWDNQSNERTESNGRKEI